MPATLMATSSSSLPEGPPTSVYMGRYNGNDLNGSANARTFNKSKRRAAQQIYTSLEPSQEQAPLSATVTATATEGTGTAHKRSMSYDIHTNGHDLQSNEKLPTLNETGAASPYYDVTDEKDIHTSNSYNRNSFIDSTISRFISRPETPTLSTRHTEGDTRTWSLPSLSGHFNVSLSDNFKFIILCLMWYSTSAFTNNIGKQILMQFRYPVTLTYVQFGLVSLSCFVLTRITGITQIRKPDMAIIKTVLPLAGFQIVGHVFSSVAISRVPVSLVHTIKVSCGGICPLHFGSCFDRRSLFVDNQTLDIKIGSVTIVHCPTVSLPFSSPICFGSLHFLAAVDPRCHFGLFIYLYNQCTWTFVCSRILLGVCFAKRV